MLAKIQRKPSSNNIGHFFRQIRNYDIRQVIAGQQKIVFILIVIGIINVNICLIPHILPDFGVIPSNRSRLFAKVASNRNCAALCFLRSALAFR